MGEKLATLGRLCYRGKEYEVELNEPVRPGFPRQIHIQSESMRLELTEEEFVQTVSAFLLAAEKLKRLKNIQ